MVGLLAASSTEKDGGREEMAVMEVGEWRNCEGDAHKNSSVLGPPTFAMWPMGYGGGGAKGFVARRGRGG